MINSEYPLCVDCESCGELTVKGKVTYICDNENVQNIDVVTGIVKSGDCLKQRKSTGMESFGIVVDPNVCGLRGQFFKKKVLDNQ